VSREPVAWVLNLAAEEELRRRGHGPLPAVLRALVAALVPHARARLLHPDDEVVGFDSPLRARVGACWCPTPSALTELDRVGIARPGAPPLDVLRQVTSRAFSAALGQTLHGARYVHTVEDARAVLSSSHAMLLKRPFAMAGRGQRRVALPLGVDDERFLAATIRQGDGLQVEPWVPITEEFSVHGYIAAGRVSFGTPCRVVVTDGAFRDARRVRAGDLSSVEETMLHEEASRVSAALIDAGYFGPFGIDAYHYRTAAGIGFNARSEINPRYTMAFATGMGDVRWP
jgi:hypothetical protein